MTSEGDRTGCQRDGLQATGTEAVDGHGAGLNRQTRQQTGQAGHIEALLTLGHRAAEDDIFHHLGLHLRHSLEQPRDDLSSHLVGTSVDQRTLVSTTYSGSHSLGNDNVSHG